MNQKILKNLKKYKFLYLIDILIIIFIFLYPMENMTSNYVSSEGYRIGYILDKDAVVRQKFLSSLDNIERISLMISTIDTNTNCDILYKMLDEKNDIIDEQKLNNKQLSYTESPSDSSTDYVNFYLKNKQFNTKNSVYYIELSTNCDSIIKVQYYDVDEQGEKVIYNGIETNKKMAIRYSGVKKSYNNILYPSVMLVMTLIVVLGGKNEK